MTAGRVGGPLGKVVVVTGSTRGIGRGLALELGRRGCRVVVSGRRAEAAEEVAAELAAEIGPGSTGGYAGFGVDVTDFESVQALWDAAADRFGRIDVWINNAGVSSRRVPLWEQDPAEVRAVVDTNLTGAMYGSAVALRGMLAQGSGQLWNVEGFGSGGQLAPGIAPYGATKRAVRYLNKALLKETKRAPVQICTLSPGIVLTDLLVRDYEPGPEWERAKKFFNILGDRVETVTPWLAEKILAIDKTGATVAWLTRPKAFGRFATAFKKRDVVGDAAPAPKGTR